MSPSLRLVDRSTDAASTTSQDSGSVKIGSLSVPVYAIVGVSLAVVVVLALLIYLFIRLMRRRAKWKREKNRDSAFLVVKGVMKESSLAYKGPAFSRNNLTMSVVLPDKAIIHPDASPGDILEYYTQQGTLPRPFAPFSFALNAGQGITSGNSSSTSSQTAVEMNMPTLPFTDLPDKRVSTQSFSASAARLPPSPTSPTHRFPSRFALGAGSERPESALAPSQGQAETRDSIAESFFNVEGRPSMDGRASSARGSFMGLGPIGSVVRHLRSGSSTSFGGIRFSVLSGTSLGGESYTNSVRGVSSRLVRQVFTPILPDELHLALGECVTVLRSFDDGWVIAARSDTKSLGVGSKEGGDVKVEMGAVPAWCFVKPMKGLRSERPVRSSSLGVTVQMEDEAKPRDDIISWSNF